MVDLLMALRDLLTQWLTALVPAQRDGQRATVPRETVQRWNQIDRRPHSFHIPTRCFPLSPTKSLPPFRRCIPSAAYARVPPLQALPESNLTSTDALLSPSAQTTTLG